MEYSSVESYRSSDYLYAKEMADLRKEVFDLKIEVHDLREKLSENKSSFIKGMLAMMYITFIIALIAVIIKMPVH